MERRVHQLEPLDYRPGLDELAKKTLRIGARRKLDLEGAICVVDARDERAIA